MRDNWLYVVLELQTVLHWDPKMREPYRHRARLRWWIQTNHEIVQLHHGCNLESSRSQMVRLMCGRKGWRGG